MDLVESYNLIDAFIMGTLLVTLILGLWKGFIRSLTAVAGLVIGVLGALKYYTIVQPYLGKISSLDPHISMILSMIIVFIAVQAIFVLIRRILSALIDVTRLSWLDRALGGIMGMAAGLLIVAGAVQTLVIVLPEWPVVKTSRLIKPVNALTAKAMTYAPKQAKDYLQSLIAKWKGTQEQAPSRQPVRRAPVKKAPAASPGPGR